MQKAKAEYIKYLRLEKSFSQQKSGYEWFECRDRNTEFFIILSREEEVD